MPWSAAHEKLLTAYVGGALPDVVPARQHLAPRVRRARRARAARRARRRDRRRSRATTTSPASATRNVVDGDRCSACPGTSTRACSSTARDLLRARRLRRAAARPGPSGVDAMRRVQARRGARRATAIAAAAQRVRAAAPLGAAAGAPLLRDDGDARRLLAAPAFRRALDFYVELFRDGLAPPLADSADRRTSSTSSRAATFAFYITARGTSASSGAACRAELQRRWATAPLPGPDGARRVDRRRLEPRRSSALAAARTRRGS